MKNIFTLLFASLMILNMQAQKKIKYEDVKYKYDYRNYDRNKGGRYSPGLAGFLSAYPYPGLGQMYCGEAERGLYFLGGWMACATMTGIGLSGSHLAGPGPDPNKAPTFVDKNAGKLMAIGIIGGLTIRVWSSVDAVRVAKIKNMAINDRSETSKINFGFNPYVTTCEMNNKNLSVGGTLKVSF